MQVRMNPCGFLAGVILHEDVGPLPFAVGVLPQRLERMRRIRGSLSAREEIFR